MTATFDARLYLRDVEVIIGTKVSSTNAPLRPPDAISFRGLKTSFEVTMTSGSEPNKALIRLFNLAQTSRNFMESENLIVFLNAGYRDSLSNLFFGDIADNGINTERSGADIITTIEAGDAEKILTTAHIEIGLGPGATNTQIITQAISIFKISLAPSAAVPPKVFLGGFSFSGLVKDLLDNLIKQEGFEWNITNGELQILSEDKTNLQTAVLITQDTGLIGFPTKTQKIATFNSLLNSRLVPGRPVELRSKQIQGFLDGVAGTEASSTLGETGLQIKCKKVVHLGDSSDGQYISQVEGDIQA